LGENCINDTFMYHNHQIVSYLSLFVRVETICMIQLCNMKHWVIDFQNEFFFTQCLISTGNRLNALKHHREFCSDNIFSNDFQCCRYAFCF
jgi:hypothetical protein